MSKKAKAPKSNTLQIGIYLLTKTGITINIFITWLQLLLCGNSLQPFCHIADSLIRCDWLEDVCNW